MQSSPLPLALLIVAIATPFTLAAEPAALPEPGPEDGGLRMRLIITPRTAAKAGVKADGFKVRVDLVNTTDRAITLRANWDWEDRGDLKDYIDAATSIETEPAIRPWMGGVMAGRRKSPQPQHVIKPGQVLTVRWETKDRRLKNRVTNPNDVQNPELRQPGLYAVRARLNVITDAGTFALRSNEQLVPVGGSRSIPKSTFGQLWHVNGENMTAMISLGALQKIKIGDRFEYFTKRENGVVTITSVSPGHAYGRLEMKHSRDGSPPARGMAVSLVKEK